jgi:hypothetical protein
VLKKHPIDYLIVEGIEVEIWEPWLKGVEQEFHPPTIVVFSAGKDLSTEKNVVGKRFRKVMQRWGYHGRYWTMEAWKYGAALNQVRLVTVFRKSDSHHTTMGAPLPINLPVQSMSNLLMPVGVPQKARNRRPVQRLPSKRTLGPEVIGGYIDGKRVYQVEGAMPDRVGSWIEHPSEIRRLQHQELAKAKGILDDYGTPNSQGELESTREGTCIHLLTAVLDHVGRSKESLTDPMKSPEKSQKEDNIRMWSDEEEDEKDQEWEWEVPDLQEGSERTKARLQTLSQAMEELEEPEYWYQEGVKCLARHRLNYTTEGPQQLQLLWWEFPREHWTTALREGCRLGFLATPEGKLALNGKLTDIEREVAGRFVDELKKLGVLIPAREELQANCPLFCVDKSYDSDQKGCIANCKERGQNACMGKDPVYLLQKETMLWSLYAGGWTGIADASNNSITSRLTQKSGNIWDVCILLLTKHWFMQAYPWGLRIAHPSRAESIIQPYEN